jgi:hypothetical protein
MGYQLLTKPFYFNDFFRADINTYGSVPNTGVFVQLQPMIGLGYNFRSGPEYVIDYGYNDFYFDNMSRGVGNIDFLAGGNIYFGTNNKQLFFIIDYEQLYFGNKTLFADLHSTNNGRSYLHKISTLGTGTSYCAGVPIRVKFQKHK